MNKTGNKRDYERFEKKVEKIRTNYQKTKREICKEYAVRVRKAFNAIKYDVLGSHSRTSWYDTYAPKEYHRTYDLVHIPHIEVDIKEGTFEYHLSSDNMKKWHRIYKYLGAEKGKEYLWNLSFIDGWHGGSRPLSRGGTLPPDAAGNPFPGSYDQPYWRKPGKPAPWPLRYSLWGWPAVRSKFSPADVIMKRFKEEELEIRKDAVKETEIAKSVLNKELKEAWNRYYGDRLGEWK